MNSITSNGLICIRNKLNIEFVVCKIEYILYEDESFKYIFLPYYDVIDLIDTNIFQGIPGIDLDLKKEKYIRDNVIPTFISERVPSENRENFYELLQTCGLNYMNPIEYLIRSKNKYSGDYLYLKPFSERKEIVIENVIGKSNTLGIIKKILNHIAHGNKVIINKNLVVNDNNLFRTLMYIYSKGYAETKEKQEVGILAAKKIGRYKGRKPVQVDQLVFLEQIDMLNKGIITLSDALNNLNISKATFYRLKKKYQK